MDDIFITRPHSIDVTQTDSRSLRKHLQQTFDIFHQVYYYTHLEVVRRLLSRRQVSMFIFHSFQEINDNKGNDIKLIYKYKKDCRSAIFPKCSPPTGKKEAIFQVGYRGFYHPLVNSGHVMDI